MANNSYFYASYASLNINNDVFLELTEKGIDEELAYPNYLSNHALNVKIQPLALYSNELFADMCKEQGLIEESKFLYEMERMEYGLYRAIENECTDETQCFESTSGVRIQVSKDFIERQFAAFDDRSHLCHFYKYRGVWYFGSNTFTIGKGNKAFQNEVTRQKRIKEATAELSQLFLGKEKQIMLFAKSPEDYKHFKKIKELALLMGEDIPIDGMDTALYISETNVHISNYIALCLKHKDNPLYDKEIAETSAINALIGFPHIHSHESLHFLLDNNMLEDGSFYDIDHLEESKRMFRENIDFLARCQLNSIY